MKFLILAILLSSCVKDYKINAVSSIGDMDCQSKENCTSSLPFKFLAQTPSENIEMINSAAKKYEVQVLDKTEKYLHLKLNKTHLEFLADEQTREILIKAQLESKNLLGNESPEKLIEKIRFDFFQKNY